MCRTISTYQLPELSLGYRAWNFLLGREYVDNDDDVNKYIHINCICNEARYTPLISTQRKFPQ
jgi:hypothetical protein